MYNTSSTFSHAKRYESGTLFIQMWKNMFVARAVRLFLPLRHQPITVQFNFYKSARER